MKDLAFQTVDDELDFTVCFPTLPAGMEVVRNAIHQGAARLLVYLFGMPRRALCTIARV
jgi:hypothetical protein